MATNLIEEYLNLKNKFSKEFAKKVVADMWKQYTDVDTVTVNVNDSDIDGFKFHILEREQVDMEADVSDHYIDTNRAVQDHIAWKPIKISMVGKVGEYYNDITENKGYSVAYYQVMGVVNSYLPRNTDFAIFRQIKSTVSRMTGGSGFLNRIANTLTSEAYGVLLNAIKQLNYDLVTLFEEEVQLERMEQVKAYVLLESFFKVGIPLKITTSWRSYENMICTNLKPIRDGNADVTEFNVTFKQISTASTIETNKTIAKERTAQQKSDVVDNGKTTGNKKELDVSQIDKSIK